MRWVIFEHRYAQLGVAWIDVALVGVAWVDVAWLGTASCDLRSLKLEALCCSLLFLSRLMLIFLSLVRVSSTFISYEKCERIEKGWRERGQIGETVKINEGGRERETYIRKLSHTPIN